MQICIIEIGIDNHMSKIACPVIFVNSIHLARIGMGDALLQHSFVIVA